MILSDMRPLEHLRQAPLYRPEKWNKGLINVPSVSVARDTASCPLWVISGH